MKPTSKSNPYKIALAIVGSIMALLVLVLIYETTFSPDAINSRNHVPETGWEVLVAVILIVPALFILLVVELLLALAYIRRKRKIAAQIELEAHGITPQNQAVTPPGQSNTTV